MERALSYPDGQQTRCPDSRHNCLSNTKSPCSQTLPVTSETLRALSSQSSASKGSTQSIEQWASNCDSCSEPDMALPQTPSVTSSDSAQRRVSKLSYRRQRSQSPSKKSSTQYRVRNMADASIFVDHFPKPPSDVEDQLKHIFEVSILEHIGRPCSSHHDLSGVSAVQNKIEELAEKYCHMSRQAAKDCAGEGAWKSHLSGLVEPMRSLWPEIIALSQSEKPWISELRPTSPSLKELLRSVPPLPIPPGHSTHTAEPQTPLPPSRDPVLGQTPILSLPSNTPSDFTTDDPNRVSIPKPDIAVGLSHTSFSQLQGKLLWALQDSNDVFSEPHQSAIGLHFPFLIFEANGLATGSNMFGAQNQAAVDGACALNILRDLKLTAITCGPRASTDQPEPRQILFSVVTEGPIHELWVHYQIDGAYHMTVLRIWRTTIEKEAREFVQTLGKIFQWGVSSFRTAVLKELTGVESMFREEQSI